MTKPKAGSSAASKSTLALNTSVVESFGWEAAILEAGDRPKELPEKPFAKRAAEADAWAKELKDAPAGRPVVRMGRPSKAVLKVETELVTFRTDKREKEALEALAEALGRNLSDLLRDVTHNLVATFKAGQKSARARN